jgi:hypothetical protein
LSIPGVRRDVFEAIEHLLAEGLGQLYHAVSSLGWAAYAQAGIATGGDDCLINSNELFM